MRLLIGYFICLVITVFMDNLFYLTVIALPCTVPICGQNTRKRLSKIRVTFNNAYRRIFGLSNRRSAMYRLSSDPTFLYYPIFPTFFVLVSHTLFQNAVYYC